MIKRATLKNGIRVLGASMKSTQAFTVLVLVRAGSKYETKYTNGTAHYLEHMIFKGSKDYPSVRAITETLDGLGAEYNAFTAKELTGYWVKVAGSNASRALKIVASMLEKPLFPAQEFERERGVVLEEINMYFDTPARFIFDLWEEVLWGDQPAGWHVAGTPKIIKNLKREALLEYFQKHYVGRSSVVVMAGAMDNSIFTHARKLFSGIRTGETSQHPKVREEQKKPAAHLHFKRTDQTHLAVGFRGVSMEHPARYALSVLAAILGGTMSSRIFLEVRDKLGLAYSIRTQASFDTESGYLVTSAGVRNEKVSDAIGAILNEYRRITKTSPGATEVKKAKDAMIGHFVLDLEQTDEVASYIGTQETLLGKITEPEAEIRRLRKVTSHDVVRAARTYFRPERLNLALIGPFRNPGVFNAMLNKF